MIGFGGGSALTRPAAPCIAIPATAGTGAEVTRNAVLSSPAHRVKVSLRRPLLLPRLALVDPDLTLGLPPALTAASGLDALTQLIEPYVSSRANPSTDALCLDGLRRAAPALRRAYHDGRDTDARASRARTPAADPEHRSTAIARALTDRPDATADDAAPFTRDLVAELGIPPLRTYGLTSSHLPALFDQAARASSIKANPLPLTPDELTEILARAL